VLDPARSAQVRPRFSGVVREIRKTIGDPVQPGDVLAVIESNESLQGYQVRSPIAGRITQRWAGSGEFVADRPIFEIADIREVVAEFSVFPRHLAAVKEGQPVTVSALESDATQDTRIDVLSPVADPITQTIVARARISNAGGLWRPGMTVSGRIITGEREVPLMVRNSGLQAFRDFTVVFAKVGETYEVRMLELGESDGTHTEVLGGLKPGTLYASENSFLIKADIEKSGASHDH
jgi:membrane fusion protein, heavy metal efflux system